jgi:carbon monoxide dehydrogenase subunit G
MKIEKEFVVPLPRDEVARALDDDAVFESLFPDTRITASVDGMRETITSFSALGQTREIRFTFRTLSDGNVRFSKICDGNVWRSLEGEVRLEPSAGDSTRVVLRMEGRTRALVPELTIRGPMRDQLDQMVDSLRSRLGNA